MIHKFDQEILNSSEVSTHVKLELEGSPFWRVKCVVGKNRDLTTFLAFWFPLFFAWELCSP